MEEPACVIINYNNNKVVKYPLIKDEIYIGADPACDIVLDQPYLGEKYAIITKRGDYYVIKALTDKGINIGGEIFYEKILEQGDYSGIGDLRAEFIPQGFEHEDEHQKINIKYFKYLAAIAFCVIISIFIIGNLFLKIKSDRLNKKNESILTVKHREAVGQEKKKLSEQEFLGLIAEVRKRDIVAEKFATESDVNPHNYVYAVNEWFTALKKLQNVDSSQKMMYRMISDIIGKISATKENVREMVKFFSKSAFIANQQNNDNSLRYFLESIMAVMDNPADEDYIWAKKKYLNLIAAKKNEKKK